MPDRPATYRDLIAHEAQSAGIPPELAFAIVDAESAGRSTAIGQPTPGGQAQGFFQLMPETAKGYGVDPADPVQNIQGGIRMLGDLNKQYGGDVGKMLAAYHGGQDLKAHGPKTQAYVQGIMGRLTGAEPAATAVDPASVRQPKPVPKGMKHRVTGEAAAAVGAPPPTALPQYGTKQSLVGQPPPDPTQFEGPSSRMQEAGAIAKGVAQGFNPFNPEGRRNIAATAGGIGAGMLAAPTGPGAIAAGAAGAAAGGALAEFGEQTFGSEPYQPSEIAGAGAEQAAYELGGRAVLWPARALGRRVMGFPVAKAASEKLTAVRKTAMTALDDALDTARTVSRQARTSLAQGLRGTRAAVKEGAEQAEGRAGALTDQARTSYDQLLGNPPPREAVGNAALAAIKGPAKTVLGEYGEAVGAAAATGPDVPAQPIRDRIQELAGQITPQVGEALPTITSGTGQAYPPAVAKAIAERNPELLQSLPPELQMPGVAGYIQGVLGDAGDTLPFSEVHKIKRLLDDAVNWERPAKQQREQITKGLRQTVRESLTGHQPYDVATERYGQTVRLFNKGFVKQIQRQALEDPSSFIPRISPKTPHQTRMLKEVLLGVAAKEGPEGAAMGRRAWDGVRATWTHDKLISGGVEKLGQRIDALPPEFVATFYDDATGQQVLGNLKQIAGAYRGAVEQGRLLKATSASQGAATLEATRRAGEATAEGHAAGIQSLQRQKTLAREPTATESKFLDSTLAPDKRKKAADEVTADLIRAIVVPGTFWGAYSIGRLLHGPKSSELVEWAAYGGAERTKLLVDLLTSNDPPRAAAALLRRFTADAGEEGAGSRVGQPPTGASPVGQPPPSVVP